MLEVLIIFVINCKHICIIVIVTGVALTAVMYYTITPILTKTIAIDIAFKFLVILHVIIVESSYLDIIIAFVCDYSVRYWH